MKRGSARLPLSTQSDDPSNPYSLNWLDSIYQHTLLPGAPWHRINKDLCDTLSEFLPKQMSQLERAAVLSAILGDSFMAEYYPKVLTTLKLGHTDLRPPDDEKKLVLEASGWLKNQLLKAAKQVGSLPDGDSTALSNSMKDFIKLTSQSFYKELNRQLYNQEIAMTSGDDPVTLPLLEEELQNSRLSSPYNHFPYARAANQNPSESSEARPVNKNRSPTGSTSAVPQTAHISASSIKGERVRAATHDPDYKPDQPLTNSKPVQFLAESLVRILEKSPRRFAVVAKRLHGRPLPSKLRTYMWTESLYKAEREKLTHGANVERILRERFGRTVARNVGELRLTRATQSPVSRLIENSVLEMYDNVPALASCRNKLMMKEAVKALNILYTYDKSYEPYLVIWLFPLQVAFAERSDINGPEHVYELAMHLDILNSSLFMQWSQVYAISDLVMHHLSRHDKPLYEHLERICQINVDVKAQDFVLELMKKERLEAQELLKKPLPQHDENSQSILSNARIYIRKWIGEGFAGVLDTPAVMFVWDQLFLQDWASTVFQDFAIALLLLLRESLLAAQDHSDMRSVFLHEPCQLLTADIQRAWLMLHNKADYAEITKCNRINQLVRKLTGEDSDNNVDHDELAEDIASAPPGTTPQLPVTQTPYPEAITPHPQTSPFSTGHTPVSETPYLDTRTNSTGNTPVGQTPYLDTPGHSTGVTPAGETPIVPPSDKRGKKTPPRTEPDGEVPSTSRG